MAIKIGDRRICATCGTQVIVMREGQGEFAATCCGEVLTAQVACGSGPGSAAADSRR